MLATPHELSELVSLTEGSFHAAMVQVLLRHGNRDSAADLHTGIVEPLAVSQARCS